MMTPHQQLQQLITQALQTSGLPQDQVAHLEHPANPEFGDYSTNVAMQLAKQVGQNPRQLAQQIVEQLEKQLDDQDLVAKVEVAGPGFINFYLQDQWLVAQAQDQAQGKLELEQSGAGQQAVIEYMQPNTNKPLHVGHLRNAILSWSLIELLEAQGWQVHKATINNDRGLHIVKSMWGYLVQRQQSGKEVVASTWQELIQQWLAEPQVWLQPKNMTEERLQKPDHFVGHWYVLADASAEEPEVQKAWQEMLLAWENQKDEYHTQVRALWRQMNNWFYEGYEQSAQLLGFVFDPDHVSYESEIYEAGRQIILEAEKKGLFVRLDSGAVQAKLGEYNLPDKILLRSDGTGIYMTFDIELTRQRSLLGADLSVWAVGNDQALYFQQLFAIAEILGYGQRDDFKHFAYGMVRLPEGKMSSRKGRVVFADDILEMAIDQAQTIMEETGSRERLDEKQFAQVARQVGVGAVKWTMLGQDPLTELTFDVETSVSFKGYAAPFVQYTHARCCSILEKGAAEKGKKGKWESGKTGELVNDSLLPEEKAVARLLYQFGEVVAKASADFAPHHLAVYLFEVAQAYNTFYTQCPVLTAQTDQQKQLRLLLTQATANVLKSGLKLLGIAAPAQM